MPRAFLDSSVLIGLHFRHAGEKAACNACLVGLSARETSRYVLFEIARGFLLSLINLHNKSHEYQTFSALHQAAHSGQRLYRSYEMHTWLGAMDDFFADLEKRGESHKESEKLCMLRAFLWMIVRRGWRSLNNSYTFHNELGCQAQLATPKLNTAGLILHELPTKHCGTPDECGILNFVATNTQSLDSLATQLENLPNCQKSSDTEAKHLDGLRHLMEKAPDKPFVGNKCHRCGDLLICLEAPETSVIATKNERDFRPIAVVLRKELAISKSANCTT